jgi:hypothetical protein
MSFELGSLRAAGIIQEAAAVALLSVAVINGLGVLATDHEATRSTSVGQVQTESAPTTDFILAESFLGGAAALTAVSGAFFLIGDRRRRSA